MDSKIIIGVIVAMLIGVIVGYAITSTTIKPNTITTTIVKPTTITSIVTKTLTTSEITTTTATITSSTTITKTTTMPVTITYTMPVRIVDALGREVSFTEPPRRVVSLAPSITEILFALGLDDYIVGVDKYSNYPPKVVELVKEGKIKIVGGYWNPDIEKIINLKPDLVLASAGVPSHIQLLSKFKELGIKVVYLKADNAQNMYDVFYDIRLVARIFKVDDRAEKLIDSIEAKINNVTLTLSKANATRVKVLVLLGPPSWSLWTSGSGTFIDYVITTAGGENIAGKYHGWVQLSYEDILSANPDVIIVTVMGLKPEEVFSELAKTPLNETNAFKKGNVYVLTGEADDLLTRPGPRVGDAVELIAKILHPELFGKVSRADVAKIKTQSIQLLRMDYVFTGDVAVEA